MTSSPPDRTVNQDAAPNIGVAALLVGGLGTRVRAIDPSLPKALLNVGGRPWLSYLLDQLETWGVRRVVLCTGYLGHRVRDEFGATYGTLELEYSQEPTQLGTAGALRHAIAALAECPVLVMNGDTLCRAPLAPMAVWHAERGASATVLLAPARTAARFGAVAVDVSGAITGFDEKPAAAASGWVNAGRYLIERAVLDRLPDGEPLSLERDVFPQWLGNGLYGFRSRRVFLDIGTPAAFARAERFVAVRASV